MYLPAAEEQMITGQTARLWGFIYNARIRRPYQLLNNLDEIDAGSIKVKAISTPGHTPGSMSYLVNQSILFSGDTFKLVDNRVCLLRRYINMDMVQQEKSIRKLAKLDDIQLACTAHWGCTNKFSEAMNSWK
jgi:glyoxylase-like metal-dependent hydrolase (beta-lactamase superfamily II)